MPAPWACRRIGCTRSSPAWKRGKAIEPFVLSDVHIEKMNDSRRVRPTPDVGDLGRARTSDEATTVTNRLKLMKPALGPVACRSYRRRLGRACAGGPFAVF